MNIAESTSLAVGNHAVNFASTGLFYGDSLMPAVGAEFKITLYIVDLAVGNMATLLLNVNEFISVTPFSDAVYQVIATL